VKRIKILVLAMFGALALTATAGASAASASGFLFEKYPASVTGKETAGSVHMFNIQGKAYECSLPSFYADADGPVEGLVTVSPGEKTTCANSFEGPVTLKMNGCNWIYHPAVGEGSFDIGPSGCGPITMEGAYCTRSIPSQSGLSATFANQGSGSKSSVSIEENTSFQYTLTEGGGLVCGAKSGTASVTGKWTLSANYPVTGASIGMHVAASAGLFLTGKASEEPASQPKFEAETYPEVVLAPQSSSDKYVLSLQGREFKCGEVETGSELSGAASALSLGVTYRDCVGTILGNPLPATIKMNSCDYALNLSNAGPPYSGTVDLACGKAGDGIEVTAYSEGKPICAYKIGAQSGRSGVALSNFGSGSGRGVSAEFDVVGLTYTRTEGKTLTCGAASASATYSGTTSLRGAV
jgi:hypothetical protein